jgi:Ca2+-binding RTX toxin-like protein
MFGGAGSDRLRGDGGVDALDGGSGGDMLEGGRGSDLLKPGAGTDDVGGGSGNDYIELGPDGRRDIIECGPGYDTVAYWDDVEPLDVWSDDCEDVIAVTAP